MNVDNISIQPDHNITLRTIQALPEKKCAETDLTDTADGYPPQPVEGRISGTALPAGEAVQRAAGLDEFEVLRSDLDAVERARYRSANDYAARYCRGFAATSGAAIPGRGEQHLRRKAAAEMPSPPPEPGSADAPPGSTSPQGGG